MRRCILILAILGLTAIAAETRMSLAQLRSFIQSSKKNHLADKEVAEVLKHTTLTNKLDDSTIEDLQADGAGPRTVEALKALRDASKNLEAPPPPAPKPIVKMPDPPSTAEQEQVLKDATEYAMEHVKKLPNFICTQTTRRFGDPSGGESWRLYDTVVARLSYFEQKEDYKVF